jgi:hypothetical protein
MRVRVATSSSKQGAKISLCSFTRAVITRAMKNPPNIVKLRLDGFPLDALDQKRMRRLRRTSDRIGLPIPDLIREILGQIIDTCIAEAELPTKIVKFPARRAKICNQQVVGSNPTAGSLDFQTFDCRFAIARKRSNHTRLRTQAFEWPR